MDKGDFLKGMKYLSIAYNKGFDSEQASVWYDFFQDVDYEIFKKAIKIIILKSNYLPSICELRKETDKLSNPILQLNVHSEWEFVINQIRQYGTYITAEEFNKFSPLTMKIIKIIGWKNLCLSENIQVEKKQFYQVFENYQKEISNNTNDTKLLTE